MNRINRKFLLFLIPFLFACGNTADQGAPKPPIQAAEETPPQKPTKPAPAKTPIPVIQQNSFQNITPGDPIAKHQDRIEKGLLRTAEGNFESYQIKNEAYGPMAYFMPDPKDNKRVGDITIYSPIPSTQNGIRVGDTFGKLLVVYSGIEVHGSEIESRTYAYKDNLLFRIDEPHNTYELALKDVSKKAKILEIVIRRE